MRCLVLSNPNSTSLTHGSLCAALAPLRDVASLHSRHTQYPGHATDIVKGLTTDDYDAIIVFGGDGTVNETISGLMATPGESPLLGIIPTGSANVFARALGFPNDPAKASAELANLLKAGAYRRLPVGKVNDRWFCVNVGFGLDAEVTGTMAHMRSHGIPATPWHYALIALGAWHRLRLMPPHIHFEATTRAGGVVTGDAPFVISSNTNPWTYAGPVPVVTNPSHTTDGGLSLFAMNDISGFGGLMSVIKSIGLPGRNLSIGRETRVDDAVSITLSSKTPLKWQVDGEYVGEQTSIHISLVPAAVRIICPKDSQ